MKNGCAKSTLFFCVDRLVTIPECLLRQRNFQASFVRALVAAEEKEEGIRSAVGNYRVAAPSDSSPTAFFYQGTRLSHNIEMRPAARERSAARLVKPAVISVRSVFNTSRELKPS